MPKRPELLGKMFEVRIVSSCKFSMTGELTSESRPVCPAPAPPLLPGQVTPTQLAEVDTPAVSSRALS